MLSHFFSFKPINPALTNTKQKNQYQLSLFPSSLKIQFPISVVFPLFRSSITPLQALPTYTLSLSLFRSLAVRVVHKLVSSSQIKSQIVNLSRFCFPPHLSPCLREAYRDREKNREWRVVLTTNDTSESTAWCFWFHQAPPPPGFKILIWKLAVHLPKSIPSAQRPTRDG